MCNSDIVRSHVGLLVQGKSDFDAIENRQRSQAAHNVVGVELSIAKMSMSSGSTP